MTTRHDAGSAGTVENDAGQRLHGTALFVPSDHGAVICRDFAHRHAIPDRGAGALRFVEQEMVEVTPEHLIPVSPSVEPRDPRRPTAPANGVAPRNDEARAFDGLPDPDRLEHLPATRRQ